MKLIQVNDFIRSCNLNNWLCLEESDAIRLVDDVVEGDFNVDTEWESALDRFKEYFQSYAGHSDEVCREYDSMYL